MKSLFIVLILLCLSSQLFAGEKEELQFQQILIVERIGRLQAEYALAIIYQKEINLKLNLIAEKAKEKEEEHVEKPDK